MRRYLLLLVCLAIVRQVLVESAEPIGSGLGKMRLVGFFR